MTIELFYCVKMLCRNMKGGITIWSTWNWAYAPEPSKIQIFSHSLTNSLAEKRYVVRWCHISTWECLSKKSRGVFFLCKFFLLFVMPNSNPLIIQSHLLKWAFVLIQRWYKSYMRSNKNCLPKKVFLAKNRTFPLRRIYDSDTQRLGVHLSILAGLNTAHSLL